jgi:hypothetical protein
MAYHRNPIYDKAYELYLSGLSLEQVAKEIGVTRQAVFKAFQQRGLKMRNRMIITQTGYESLTKHKPPKSGMTERVYRKFQMYEGKKFTLRNNGYYAATTGNRVKMHRYVWQKFNGSIPIGFDIHHINEDKEDNRIENLECLSKSEHTRKYGSFNNQYGKGRRPLEVVDENGIVIETYSCTSVCAKDLNVSVSAIRNVLIGRTKRCKGKKIRYANN